MSEWTEERIELLKSLWLEGATSTVIAQKLQISRSAALGKIRRLGMQRSAMAQNDGVASHEPVKKTDDLPKKAKSKAAPTSNASEATVKKPVSGRSSASPAKEAVKPATSEAKEAKGVKTNLADKTLESLTSAFLQKKAQSDLEKKQALERQKKLNDFKFPPAPAISLPFSVSPSVSGKSEKKGPGISIWELKDSLCKWPMGGLLDPPELFCGAPVSPGCPWCEEHRAIAFTREPVKEANKDHNGAGLSRLQSKRQ